MCLWNYFDYFIEIITLFLTRCTEDFEILHGDTRDYPDTIGFLKSLAELDAVNDSEKSGETRRERKAAAGLFNWEVLLISANNHLYFSTSPS